MGGPDKLPHKTFDWEFLFAHDIPGKRQLLLFLYHLPGILVATIIGFMVNMLLEEVVKRFSKRIAESGYLNVVWIGLIVFLVFFTNLDHWVAEKTRWREVFTRPAVPAMPVSPAGRR
jgi:hypothetical protein